jgi:hypothetical protein
LLTNHTLDDVHCWQMSVWIFLRFSAFYSLLHQERPQCWKQFQAPYLQSLLGLLTLPWFDLLVGWMDEEYPPPHGWNAPTQSLDGGGSFLFIMDEMFIFLVFLMAGWMRSFSQDFFLMAGWIRGSFLSIFLMAGWVRSSSQDIFILQECFPSHFPGLALPAFSFSLKAAIPLTTACLMNLSLWPLVFIVHLCFIFLLIELKI